MLITNFKLFLNFRIWRNWRESVRAKTNRFPNHFEMPETKNSSEKLKITYTGTYWIQIKNSILLCKSKFIFAWDQILDEKIKLKRVKRIMPTWDFANMVTSNRKQNLFNKSRQFYSAFDFGTFLCSFQFSISFFIFNKM